jgi:uncharacterized protein (DUF302 family)
MKNTVKIVTGAVIGAILTAAIFWFSMPSMMLKEKASNYSIDETVTKIMDSAIANGWVASKKELHKSVEKNGGGILRPVILIDLCQAHHAFKILEGDEGRIVSVMMPCTISVYEKEDGKAYVGYMNAGILGKAFGGIVAEIMGGDVAVDQQKFIAAID